MATSSSSSTPATKERERLELEDFETAAGTDFDPVDWLNARLARSNVAFANLDQHFSSLAMRCQLLSQDASEGIEAASSQLVVQLSSTALELDRMREQALSGRRRLGSVLDDLRDADNKKQSGLSALTDMEAVKNKVETARNALREVGSWERKVRECEQLVHGGRLVQALEQLVSLRGAVNAFKMLPEYSKKEAQLQQLEEHLMSTTRRKAKQAMDRNIPADLVACTEVFYEVFGPSKGSEESEGVAKAFMVDGARKAWEAQDPGSDGSAVALAGALSSSLQAIAQTFRERWTILQALDEACSKHTKGTAAGVNNESVVATSVRAALILVASKLDEVLVRTTGIEGHSERAGALLEEYLEGFAALASCPPMGEKEELWHQCCKECLDKPGEVLPWSLVRDVVKYMVLQPMEADVSSLLANVRAPNKASEAVLAAESSAKKLTQTYPAIWARHVEERNIAVLAPAWLAGIDAASATYWKEWTRLVSTFENTLNARADSQQGAFDGGLLSECIQLHSLLHDTISKQFSASQVQALQLAMKMNGATKTPLGLAIRQKMQVGEQWYQRLGAPSEEGLKAASALLSATLSTQSATTSSSSFVPGPKQAARALPSSASVLHKVEAQAKELVIACCLRPVSATLQDYGAERREWVAEGIVSPFMSGGNPMSCITSIGEHLFAVMPQLERPHDGSSEEVQWLPAILEAVVEQVLDHVLKIRRLTALGTQQLVTDLEYLHKICTALGSSDGAEQSAASKRLSEALEVVRFLFQQQQRQAEAAAKGEAFAEEPRGQPTNNNASEKRLEKTLRIAMGLPLASA